MLTSAHIKTKARELGFDACGIAPAAELPELSFLSEWIARGYAGTMAYLARSAQRRADVRRVLPSARSVIVTATVYNTARPYSIETNNPARAEIARYAWGDDYHDVIGARLEALLAWMRETSTDTFDARVYVDTGPVQERVYAQHGGIGWIGKNTCLINRELGSWILLGEIICGLPLEADPAELDQCGSCTLCLEACPTHALVAPGVLDSTRCISYLTIEHRGELSAGNQRDVGCGRARLRMRYLPGSLSMERRGACHQRSRLAAAPRMGWPDRGRRLADVRRRSRGGASGQCNAARTARGNSSQRQVCAGEQPSLTSTVRRYEGTHGGVRWEQTKVA
jgi:hypothetical protein